jgi:hypothetical protein
MESSELVFKRNYGCLSLRQAACETREKCLCILVNDMGIAPEKTTPDGKDAEPGTKNLFPRRRYFVLRPLHLDSNSIEYNLILQRAAFETDI